MIKFFITLFILLILIILFKNFDFSLNKSNFETNNNNLEIKESKKKYTIECKLLNEIIDRAYRDSERQCYYECDTDDIVRVDTSIEYICQPFILEER